MELISQYEAVQDAAWPDGTCYGCGPANSDGLQLKSYLSEDGDQLVASFDPDERYISGAPNVAYGGLIASLIDCQSMWTAITFAHIEEERSFTDGLILYVTAELNVEYRDPTPLDQLIELRSYVDGDVGRKARVTCELGPSDETTAVGDVIAVRTAGD